MNEIEKAQEILDYVLLSLGIGIGKGFLDITKKEYNLRIKEIKFMLETD